MTFSRADQLGVAADALRDQLGMLDEIRFRFDHAGDQHLAVGQLHPLEQCPFVGVARIGGFEAKSRLGRAENTMSMMSASGTSQWCGPS